MKVLHMGSQADVLLGTTAVLLIVLPYLLSESFIGEGVGPA